MRPRCEAERVEEWPEPTALADVLQQRPVVLDGGLATHLEAQGHALDTRLWSAALLATAPEAVVDAHVAYFAAGAEVATTASYQASIGGFVAGGEDTATAARLISRSVELAREARDRLDLSGPRWIAGSVGPYGASLGNGSEYRGDDGASVGELRRWHRPRLELLAAGADVLALETIPRLGEVEALLSEVAGIGVPCWLSLTAGPGCRTRAGEPIEEAFRMGAEVTEVIAVGVNCVSPADLPELVSLAAQTGKPVAAYPNSGETWDSESASWTGPRGFHPEAVQEWIGAGARLVGGCCRVGPGDISGLAEAARRPWPAR